MPSYGNWSEAKTLAESNFPKGHSFFCAGHFPKLGRNPLSPPFSLFPNKLPVQKEIDPNLPNKQIYFPYTGQQI